MPRRENSLRTPRIPDGPVVSADPHSSGLSGLSRAATSRAGSRRTAPKSPPTAPIVSMPLLGSAQDAQASHADPSKACPISADAAAARRAAAMGNSTAKPIREQVDPIDWSVIASSPSRFGRRGRAFSVHSNPSLSPLLGSAHAAQARPASSNRCCPSSRGTRRPAEPPPEATRSRSTRSWSMRTSAGSCGPPARPLWLSYGGRLEHQCVAGLGDQLASAPGGAVATPAGGRPQAAFEARDCRADATLVLAAIPSCPCVSE